VLPAEKHLVGKAYTKNIEGVNLCLRTRNRRMVRKTACFSKKRTKPLQRHEANFLLQKPSYILGHNRKKKAPGTECVRSLLKA
jgi:hypothetical protein